MFLHLSFFKSVTYILCQPQCQVWLSADDMPGMREAEVVVVVTGF